LHKRREKERGFAVELRSNSDLRNVSLANGDSRENVLVQGTIGHFRRAGFIEGVILEIVGTRGVLRIDLSIEDIAELGKSKDEARP